MSLTYPPTLDARLSPAVSTSPSRGEVTQPALSLPSPRAYSAEVAFGYEGWKKRDAKVIAQHMKPG